MIKVKIDRNGNLILPEEIHEQTNPVIGKISKDQANHHPLKGKKIYQILKFTKK